LSSSQISQLGAAAIFRPPSKPPPRFRHAKVPVASSFSVRDIETFTIDRNHSTFVRTISVTDFVNFEINTPPLPMAAAFENVTLLCVL
jgi:hypothetical protein